MGLILAVLIWAITVATVVAFVGDYWPMPKSISVHGQGIDSQFRLTFAIVGIVFALAQIGLGYCVFRFRDRNGARAVYSHGSSKLEVIWTLATAIVFVFLGITGQRVWAQFHLSEPPADAIPIEVTGQQFAWNIRYPGPDGLFGRTDPKLIDDASGDVLGLDPNDPAGKDDIVTVNQMAIPVNRPVRVILRSKDVTHSFFVPQLRMKQDAVPGMGIMIHFTATETGQYEIACAELCGMLHWQMRAFLHVKSDQEFQDWLKKQSTF
jgi:cytochrome c oxidase subunit 2